MTVTQPVLDRRTAVVVVAFNAVAWMRRALGQLAGSEPSTPVPVGQIIVVDNASTDGTADLVAAEFPAVRLIRCPRNLGFAGGANVGIRAAGAEIVALLNPDVAVSPRTIPSLLAALRANPTAAIVGAKLLYPDGRTIQHAGGRVTYPLALADHFGYGEEDRGQYDQPRAVDYVTGALVALRASAFAAIGPFDEGFFPAYFEETDWCYRARQAGFAVVYEPGAVAIHHETSTTGKESPAYFHYYHRNRLRFVLKHYSDEQIAREFWPAELERLFAMGSPVELDALARAYADDLAVLQGRATFFANPSEVAPLPGGEVRLRMLHLLAEEAAWRADRLARAEERQTDMSDLTDLAGRARIVEPEFASPMPLVGPALVGVRRAWNWMSTKWYVRQVIQQQNAINARLAEAVATLTRDLDATRQDLAGDLNACEGTAAQSERAAVGLTRDVALLELRLQRIEDRLASIESLLRSSAERPSPPARDDVAP